VTTSVPVGLGKGIEGGDSFISSNRKQRKGTKISGEVF